MLKAAIRMTLALLSVLALVSLATAGTAHASQLRPACIINSNGQCYVPPPCSGASCVGKDPAIGCDDGTTVETVQAPGGSASIELRWSVYCQANWARITPSNWPDNWYVETADGRIEGDSGDGNWSFMVDGTQLARACIQGYGDANYACTGWH